MKKIPVRFWIAVMVFLTTYINYTTRVNMSLSIVSMTKGKSKKTPECTLLKQKNDGLLPEENPEDVTHPPLPDYGERYDWDEHVQAQILGSYFWGYVITSMPGGAASEWWGPKLVLFWAVLLSAIFNCLCVFAAWYHFALLIVCRFIIGLLAGLVYPALQVLIAKWAPPAEKGKFLACMMGNTLSTCLTWPLVGYITSVMGWDWGFYATSLQCAVYCVIFWFVASDSPDDHKFISEAEVAFIKEAQAGSVTKKKHRAPYAQILKNGPFWVLLLLHSCNLWGLYVQLQSVPKFMNEVVGFNMRDSGFLVALPHLSRLVFSFLYGYIGDWLNNKKVLSRKAVRKLFCVFSHIIPGILMASICLVGCNYIAIVALLVFSIAINGAVVLTTLSNPHDLAPNFVGSIFGINNLIGGMSGFIVPAITAVLVAEHNGTKEWGYTFILGGSVYIFGGVIFILFGSVEEQSWNRIADQE